MRFGLSKFLAMVLVTSGIGLIQGQSVQAETPCKGCVTSLPVA